MVLKINLSLPGSIANGLVYLGALKYIDENKDKIELKSITGCSFGAIIATAYSCGFSIEEIVSIIKNLQLNKLSWLNSSNILKILLGILYSRYYLYYKLKKIFKELFNWNKTKVPLHISATCANTRSVIYFNKDSEIALHGAVFASASMPVIFPCRPIKGQYFFDGSFSDNYCSEILKLNDYNIILLPKVQNSNIKINIVNKFINLFQSMFSTKNTLSLDRYIDKIELYSTSKHFFDFSDEAIFSSIKSGYYGTKKYFEEKILKHF